MDPNELHNQVRDIYRRVFDREELEISDETAAKDIPDWDSLAQINLIVAAEEAFRVRFQTAEIRALKNVGEFKALIAAKLGGAGRP
ncbi:MAG: acyl carrier protein [Elusimicrobia bacterium]|nr:acyl carrier protein [Elusimicrobiota bacterium]